MFVITEQAQAELEKGRKKRERERTGQPPESEAASGAHAAAEGWLAAQEADREGRALKTSAYTDGREGPGQPVPPGEIAAQDYTRGYLEPGHAADSPANTPGHHAAPVPHIDLTASRGHLTHINPSAPMGPGGNQ
jgi:hypothetical protein